jgi:hypothetical protein
MSSGSSCSIIPTCRRLDARREVSYPAQSHEYLFSRPDVVSGKSMLDRLLSYELRPRGDARPEYVMSAEIAISQVNPQDKSLFRR